MTGFLLGCGFSVLNCRIPFQLCAGCKANDRFQEWRWKIWSIVLRKKWILAGLLCLLLLAAVPGIFHHVTDASVAASASANTNWGLSFQEEGKTPVGNASAASLKQYNAYYAGDPSQKTIYLTFDAGYENGYTPAILDTLKKHNVKAAFFVVGNYIETSPDLVKRMVAEGHIVGNHTYHHPDMSKISAMEDFKKEINLLRGRCIKRPRVRRWKNSIAHPRGNTAKAI